MSDVQSGECSEVSSLPEIVVGILDFVDDIKPSSLVSKSFNQAYHSVQKKRGVRLTDFTLTDERLEQHGLSVKVAPEVSFEEIRNCRLPLVRSLVLAKKDLTDFSYNTRRLNKRPPTIVEAFRTFEELRTTLPNLETIYNVPIDPHVRHGVLPHSIVYGTLHIPKEAHYPPTLSLDGKPTRLGLEHMTSLLPVPENTKVIHDLVVFPALYDDIPEYIQNIPVTKSITFGASTTQRDTEMPAWAKMIQDAHQDLHGVPIDSMSFELAAPPADPADPRSIQPQLSLVRGLRDLGLTGHNSLSKLGSYRSNRDWTPTDISCLANPEFARAHDGLSHLSLGMARSESGQPWLSTPIMPQPLHSLDLRYSHDEYPTRRYRSQLEEWISAANPVEVTFSCDQPGKYTGGFGSHDR